jgi:hypothetical protein
MRPAGLRALLFLLLLQGTAGNAPSPSGVEDGAASPSPSSAAPLEASPSSSASAAPANAVSPSASPSSAVAATVTPSSSASAEPANAVSPSPFSAVTATVTPSPSSASSASAAEAAETAAADTATTTPPDGYEWWHTSSELCVQKKTSGKFKLGRSCTTKDTIELDGTLEINGDAAKRNSISGKNNHNIFVVKSGDHLTLKDIVLTEAKGGTVMGGAVSVTFGGKADILWCVFERNRALSGGAVSVAGKGELKVIGSTFVDNTATSKEGHDIFIAGEGNVVLLVNNEYKTSGAERVGGTIEGTIQPCGAAANGQDQCIKALQTENVKGGVTCMDLPETRKGIKCRPENVPVIESMKSEAAGSEGCNGPEAKLSTDHHIRGCPAATGAKLVIRGSGFGNQAGRVQFETKTKPLDAAIDSWSNEKIVCTLPDMMGTGIAVVVTNKDGMDNKRGVRILGREVYGSDRDLLSIAPPSVSRITPSLVDTLTSFDKATGEPKKLNIFGNDFGVTKPQSSIQVIFGKDGATVNGTSVEWVSNTNIRCNIPAGAGRGIRIRVAIEGHMSTEESTKVTLDFRPPRITNFTSGLFGGKMVIHGTNFGALIAKGSELTDFTIEVSASNPCDKQAISCVKRDGEDMQIDGNDADGDGQRNNDVRIVCDYQAFGHENDCSGRFLVATIAGQQSNRYPMCWGKEYTGGLLFANTPCGYASGPDAEQQAQSSKVKEGKIYRDTVSLTAEPKDKNSQVLVSVISSSNNCVVLSGDLMTFNTSNARTGLPLAIKVEDDGIYSAATAPAGFKCLIQLDFDTDDAYFKGSPKSSHEIIITGAGCGVGEYLGDSDGTLVRDRHPLDNRTQCSCSVGYFRNNIGWCAPCPEGADCTQTNTRVGTVRSLEGFWRENTTSEVFFKCEGSQGVSPCVGGYAHNKTQCSEGHTSVLCGACEGPVVKNLTNSQHWMDGNITVHDSVTVFYAKRDRPSYFLSERNSCRKCEIRSTDVTPEAVRGAVISTIILTTFTGLVLFLLCKSSIEDVALTKVVPDELAFAQGRGEEGAGRKGLSQRLDLVRQRLWLLAEYFQVVSHVGIVYAVNWPDTFRGYFQWFTW